MSLTLVTITGSIYHPSTGAKIIAGSLFITPSGMVISGGELVGTSPVEIPVPGSGNLSFGLAPNPSGPTYLVEFDPDPADTVTPRSLKSGYFKKAWTVQSPGPLDLASL